MYAFKYPSVAMMTMASSNLHCNNKVKMHITKGFSRHVAEQGGAMLYLKAY